MGAARPKGEERLVVERRYTGRGCLRRKARRTRRAGAGSQRRPNDAKRGPPGLANGISATNAALPTPAHPEHWSGHTDVEAPTIAIGKGAP